MAIVSTGQGADSVRVYSQSSFQGLGAVAQGPTCIRFNAHIAKFMLSL